MDQGANHLHFFANFGLEKMSPNDHTPLGGLLSMEEGFVVMSSSGSASEGESSSIDADAADDDDTINSIGSTSSSSDLVEDDDASSSSSPPTNGPLYELSELMAQLPIKRGLSKFYQGKSQSYASLASVKSLEDLAKKGHFPKRQTMKSCKSYSGLEGRCFSPKATISKRASRGSFLSSSNLGRRSGSFVGSIGIPCPHRTTS